MLAYLNQVRNYKSAFWLASPDMPDSRGERVAYQERGILEFILQPTT